MILVTVGTHEQPFDRLVEEVDRLKGTGQIEDDVFIQTGYSTYRPRFCKHREFTSFREMMERTERARLVITHGGPGSIMPVIYLGKIPIAVPRQKRFNEHVDDHQVSFCKKIAEKGKIIAVYEIEDLEQKIRYYDDLAAPLIRGREAGVEAKTREIGQALELICRQMARRNRTK
jgi:UDP-N-acetylglucosamine transferase subunit ALG13